jgi:CheY-like chemotaxis protein
MIKSSASSVTFHPNLLKNISPQQRRQPVVSMLLWCQKCLVFSYGRKRLRRVWRSFRKTAAMVWWLEGYKTMDDRINVLIVDDQVKTRRGLKVLLKFSEKIRVVGEASNGAEAIAKIQDDPPHVVLMDLQMPVVDGFQATRWIKKNWPDVKVVTMTVTAYYRKDAVAAGADYFLVKGDPKESIHQIIQDVHSGEITNQR